MNWKYFFILALVSFLYSCSVSKQINKSAKQEVIDATALQTSHVGISIYEPATGKFWYNYQGDKYFVPASNTKLPTCYAAMKYLGDSLVGLRYGYSEEKNLSDIIFAIQPTGDPTFFHPGFKKQPVWNFLQQKSKLFKDRAVILDTSWQDERWGRGWSWNDYESSYMPERNSFPIFGNLISARLKTAEEKLSDNNDARRLGINVFKTQLHYFDSILNRPISIDQRLLLDSESNSEKNSHFNIKRKLDNNEFEFVYSQINSTRINIPFVTNGNKTTLDVISEKLRLNFSDLEKYEDNHSTTYYCPAFSNKRLVIKKWNIIHSQPTDSLLKPMMHRSDNFFAEQTLLMVSNELLGVMNDAKIIDTLLKTDFKDLPQKPHWVDGSGLSRYNLFTPQDFVFILNKMRTDFGMERIKNILATGNTGTLTNYYKAENGFIFAKTGTLSGVVAISGFLYTKKNKLLIFSVLVNNHQSSATEVRKDVEKFIENVRNNY